MDDDPYVRRFLAQIEVRAPRQKPLSALPHVQHGGIRLAKRVHQQGEGFFQHDGGTVGTLCRHRFGRGGQHTAQTIGRHLALERRHAIRRRDRRAVVKRQARPRGEIPGQFVGRGLEFPDHLRMDRAFGIHREQRVEYKVAEDSRCQ